MKISTAILCFFLSVTAIILPSEKHDFEYSIDSQEFGTNRKFYVHVHEDYYSNEIDSFGVIYILDAQVRSFYNNAKGIIDYLGWSTQIRPMIVVGIHSESRFKEFIPLDRSQSMNYSENIGEAHKLRAHIENEIFPILERDFRTNKFKAIIGHSRGGAFIANTIFSDKRDMFNAYIAISPAMHYLNNQILDDASEMIKRKEEFHNFFYCSYGTVGFNEAYFAPQVNFLDSLFKENPNETIEWRKKEFIGKTHWNVVAPSMVEGIVEMNRSYYIDQLLIEEFVQNENESIQDQIDNYKKQQQKKLEYSIPIEANSYRRYGDELSEVENYHRAIELYDLALSLNKNDLRNHLRKASAYRELKQFNEAEEVYKNALKIVELNELHLTQEELERRKKKVLQKIENMNKNKE